MIISCFVYMLIIFYERMLSVLVADRYTFSLKCGVLFE